MAEYIIQGQTLTDIADAIRTKDGSSAPILTEDMASAIIAIPSGNPNTQQTIVGNVANPWGDVDYTQLVAALASGDAHATIAFVFNDTRVMMPLASNGYIVYCSAATIGEDVASSFSAVLKWHSTGLIAIAKAIMGGQLQNLISYTPRMESVLTIYWHPMPD